MGKQKERPKSWAEQKASIKKDNYKNVFVRFEWYCEWASYWLSRWAFLAVLEYVGKLGILFVAIAYIYPGCEQRKQAAEDSKKTRHYVAWQTINSAVGKPGNAGRSDALQELNDDHVELYGISLKGSVILEGTRLKNAKLVQADLSNGVYEKVDFSGAILYQSLWNGSVCYSCDFRGAQFDNVTFTNVTFEDCNFAGVSFGGCAWNNVHFYCCNFAFADLSGVKVGRDTYAPNGNLFGASNASPAFVSWASQQSCTDFKSVITLVQWWKVEQPLRKRPWPALGDQRFQTWASNQFLGNRNGWLEWSSTNLNNH